MAHFYGIVEGSSEKVVSHVGSKHSGLKTVAKSTDSCIEVNLYVDRFGQDCATIKLENETGTYILFDGVMSSVYSIEDTFRSTQGD
jgi:hypothetical protein